MNFNKTILDNGLRIITVPQKNSLTATVLFLVAAGSKYETKEINGVSHFLEHMCFKGTERRPKSITISSELDAIGAQYNAFTGKEYTGYYAKARHEDLETIFDILSDIYLHSIFDSDEINKERGVIIEEINMYEDMPMRQTGDLFAELLYGDQPAGWDIAGSKKVVRSLERDAFVDYHNKHYLPNATTLVVAGNIDEKKVLTLIKSAFAHSKKQTKEDLPKTTEKQNSPAVKLKYKKTDQAHIALGVRTINTFDERRHALSLMANILGGWMSSRLFQRIREAMGAAYYVRASTNLFYDHGYLAASAGITLSKIEEVISAILDEFRILKDVPVPAHELELAKGNVVGSLAINLETSDDLATFYGIQEIVRGEVVDIDKIVEKIYNITAADIQMLAKEIFQENRLNLALIGPFKTVGKFEDILSL